MSLFEGISKHNGDSKVKLKELVGFGMEFGMTNTVTACMR